LFRKFLVMAAPVRVGETMEIGADAEIRHTQFMKLVVYRLLCVDS
jgi:hypothetical protein